MKFQRRPSTGTPQLNLLLEERVHPYAVKARQFGADAWELLGFLFDVLVYLPVGIVSGIVRYVRETSYRTYLVLGRLMTRTRVRFSREQAMVLAREYAGARRYSYGASKVAREAIAHYEIYVEIEPSHECESECMAAQILVDLNTGEVISTRNVPCEHNHDGPCLMHSRVSQTNLAALYQDQSLGTGANLPDQARGMK